MSTAVPLCPSCQSESVMKNGRTRHQKQNYKCRDCPQQFVEDPPWRMISNETKAIVDRLLQEKVSLAGIARAAGNLTTAGATVRQRQIAGKSIVIYRHGRLQAPPLSLLL
jgi:transposase-like protein